MLYFSNWRGIWYNTHSKKDDKADKTSDRPISMLPNLTKVYDRLICNQMFPCFHSVFPKFQFGFRKGLNTQHCLLTTAEKWHKTLDEGGETRSVLTDITKVFDWIDHYLLIATLDVYGFEKMLLQLIHSYLTRCKQRTTVDCAFSSWKMLFTVVPQGSVLGPLLFNIYISHVFFETPENIKFAGYADINTPYTYSSKMVHVLTNLQGASEKLFC